MTWKSALAPSPACIAIEKLAEPLSDLDTKHLAGCPRCQSELALLREFSEGAPRPEDSLAVSWIAQELRRRSTPKPVSRMTWWQRLLGVPAYRLSGALASILLLAGGVAVYTMRTRTGVVPGAEAVLRSQSVVLISPVGDLDSPPSELRWQLVASAAAYTVEIVEVDRHGLWKSETSETRLVIPANVRALMAPGKTLLWQVTAANSGGSLATSGYQKFRVKVKKTLGGEL
jgi:hypothetical protein